MCRTSFKVGIVCMRAVVAIMSYARALGTRQKTADGHVLYLQDFNFSPQLAEIDVACWPVPEPANVLYRFGCALSGC